jgi:hypothetical protein
MMDENARSFYFDVVQILKQPQLVNALSPSPQVFVLWANCCHCVYIDAFLTGEFRREDERPYRGRFCLVRLPCLENTAQGIAPAGVIE